jgi:UTP--glucose-1-phosphate uridylyltransferase
MSMQHTVKKAVIPAAGIGTRMLPATKAQPKEMLVIVDKPVIQYVVEEAALSGITDILIIISDGKEVLREHFSKDKLLEDLLRRKGKTAELEEIIKLTSLCNIQFEYQHEQKGLGDAILCAEKFVGNEPFAVLLGDTIIESQQPLTGLLALDYEKMQNPVVALQQVDISIAHRYGVFVGEKLSDRFYKAMQLVEKPPKDNIPSNLVFTGRYVFPPDIFRHLRNTAPGVNNEIQLTDAMRGLMTERDLYGHLFDGVRHDVGNKLDFINTNVMLGLKRGEMGEELRGWLRGLSG